MDELKFEKYIQRVICRDAAQIPEGASIHCWPSREGIRQATVGDVCFTYTQLPLAGDYILKLSDDDVYHVGKDLFERNNRLSAEIYKEGF